MTTETCEACGGPLDWRRDRDGRSVGWVVFVIGLTLVISRISYLAFWQPAPDPIPGLYVPGDDEPQNPMAPSGGAEPPMPLPGPEKPRVR